MSSSYDVYKLMFSDGYTEVIRDLKDNTETLNNFVNGIFKNKLFLDLED